MTSLPYLQ